MDIPHPDQVVVSARRVGKKFHTQAGELKLFEQLDLEVSRGESVAIIGPSGAGKSTLLSLLAGLDQPSSGEIRLSGHDLAQLSESDRALLRSRSVSFVFQSFHLLPELSALDNVCLPLDIRGDRNAADTARQWLERVGLSDRADHLPAQLSGGEQQRVAIARAFATGPEILFADEPTGNLDSDTGAGIVDQLFALNAQQGTTLILITHDAQLADRCSRRLRLRQGQLQEVQPA
ncbi:ABC transporter ATP-binding protein [Marinobacterium nitratireducens]|uniref:ABC transporter ATP-binding protein n=1 Tax=Marinobacterium nitratireducens TaxID=518897 RepID=A0A918DXV7_9GAMM|nr:ABC transporter ATP-binding protein [Marinobacterium nitratireducens]GGO87828.1 ABC transporter ATP-binding protein [Marinobacterium nitratireducens]